MSTSGNTRVGPESGRSRRASCCGFFESPSKGLLQQALQFLTVLFVFPVLPPSGSPLHAVVSLFPPPGAPQQLAGTKSGLLLCPGLASVLGQFVLSPSGTVPLQQSLRFVFSFSLPELPAAIIVGFVFLQGLRSWSAFGFSLWATVRAE